MKLRSPYGLPTFHLLITRKAWGDFPLSSLIINTAQGGQFWVSTGDQFWVVIPKSANDLLMFNERDRFLTELQALPDSNALMAVYDFIVQANQKSLKKPEAVKTIRGI